MKFMFVIIYPGFLNLSENNRYSEPVKSFFEGSCKFFSGISALYPQNTSDPLTHWL